MDADAVRDKLMAQHDGIRVQLNRCKILARGLLAGAPVALQLDAALSRLRDDFVDHNTTETALVGPLLHGLVNRGPLLVDRMLEEHVAEHKELWVKLAGTAGDVATRIDDVIEELEAHMAAEERTFLSPLVLRTEPYVPQRC